MNAHLICPDKIWHLGTQTGSCWYSAPRRRAGHAAAERRLATAVTNVCSCLRSQETTPDIPDESGSPAQRRTASPLTIMSDQERAWSEQTPGEYLNIIQYCLGSIWQI